MCKKSLLNLRKSKQYLGMKRCVGYMFLNAQKAFDTVLQNRLLKELEYQGCIRRRLFKWINLPNWEGAQNICQRYLLKLGDSDRWSPPGISTGTSVIADLYKRFALRTWIIRDCV